MLWRMPADSRARRLGVMSSHRVRKVCGGPPAGRANRPMAPSPRFPAPYYGAQEFPVVEEPSCAISVASFADGVVSPISRPLLRRARIPGRGKDMGRNIVSRRFRAGRFSRVRPLAEIGKALAEIAEIAHPIRQCLAGNDRATAAGHSLTPRTLVHRLPRLCLSGPLRSELSARSADRGRVVPVLDRLTGGHPSLLLRRVARDNRL